MARIAIIAAMPREIAPLVRRRGWIRSHAVSDCPSFENNRALVVCAGIGYAAARRATEDLLLLACPDLLVSAGLAGGLTPGWATGQVMIPATIVGASGSRFACSAPGRAGLRNCRGTLFSGASVAGIKAKEQLACRHGADAIDMEAAAVAEVAARAGIPFLAVKAICDEWDFPMPDLAPFIDPRGQFRTWRFSLHLLATPSRWTTVSRLALRSSRAARALGDQLHELLHSELANAGTQGQGPALAPPPLHGDSARVGRQPEKEHELS